MVEGFRKTFMEWLNQRLVAEIYLEANTDEQAQAIKQWLDQRPEVEAILPNWSAPTRVGGWPVDVYGFRDHATYRDHWPLLDATDDAWDRVRAGNAALISEQLARRLDVALGDTFQVPPQGDWPVEAVGIYADYGNPKGQLRIDSNALLTYWPGVPRTNYSLRVLPTAAPALIEALRATFGWGIRQLIDQASLKGFSARIFERTFTVTAALNALTLGVAGVALLTSLLTQRPPPPPARPPLGDGCHPPPTGAHRIVEDPRPRADHGTAVPATRAPGRMVPRGSGQCSGLRLAPAAPSFPGPVASACGAGASTALLAAIPPLISSQTDLPGAFGQGFCQ